MISFFPQDYQNASAEFEEDLSFVSSRCSGLSIRQVIGHCPDVAVALGYCLEDRYLQCTGGKVLDKALATAK